MFNGSSNNLKHSQKYFFIKGRDLNEEKTVFYILGTINVSGILEIFLNHLYIQTRWVKPNKNLSIWKQSEFTSLEAPKY